MPVRTDPDDDRDVVGATALERQLDHAVGAGLRVRDLDRVGERLVGHHPGEAVRAEQVAVTNLRLQLGRVHFGLFAGGESLRDVIAFPKTQTASDPMTGAPGAVDARQLNELSVRLKPGLETG